MPNFFVSHHELIKLTDEEAKRIFEQYLSHLEDGRWVDDNGKIMTEVYTSHRFDTEVGDSTHPDYELLVAIKLLRGILKERDNAKKVHTK